MCGIGVMFPKDQDFKKLAIKLTESLKKRGPNGSGFYMDSDIIMVNTRLSINDPVMGGLPIQRGHYVMCYNGEVYNYKEIRRELNSTFMTGSDAEVVLNAYIKWGSACLGKFNGEFAICIWDRKKKELFIARDRVGIKQLYHGDFIIASDVSTIMKFETPLLDMDSVKENFRYKCSLSGTMWKNIKQFPAGSCGVWGKEIKEYWKPERTKEITNESEAYEELDYLIQDSVKLRTHEDGIVMQGGVDSQLLTKLSGLRYVTVNKFPQNIEETVRNYEQPFFSLSPNLSAAKKIKNKIILNGLGVDELFAGYPYYSLFKGSALDYYFSKHKMFNNKARSFEFSENGDKINDLGMLDILYYLRLHHLPKCDRHFSNEGKELRLPYLDHRIVEFALNLTSHLKLRGNRKYLFKKVAQKYLPYKVVHQKKLGFRAGLVKSTKKDRKVVKDLINFNITNPRQDSHVKMTAEWMYQNL